MSYGKEENKESDYYILAKNGIIAIIIDKHNKYADVIRRLAWSKHYYNVNTNQRPCTQSMLLKSKIAQKIELFRHVI